MKTLHLTFFDRSRKSADRLRGDAARARGDWALAAQHYEAHLAVRPEDWRTRVQLGHARKEHGDYAAADAAYREALLLAPNDADLHLQIGHLLKLRCRLQEAADAYARALELDPLKADAHRELTAIGRGRLAQRMSARAVEGARALSGHVYDIGDMLSYFQHAHHPSGIQRVQIEFCRRLLRSANVPHFIMFSEMGGIFAVDAVAVERVIALLDRRDRSFDEQKRLIQALVANARPVRLAPSATLIILGAFWVMRDTIRSLSMVKASGVRIGAYIYDLIPIEHPEYCDIDLVRRFTDNFHQLCAIADFFLTISDYTRHRVVAHLAMLGRQLPVEAIPLAHEIPMDPPGEGGAAALPPALEGRRFALCVCTVEPRKNHALLFAIWRRLEREYGAETPLLVFAGRPGWNVSNFVQQLENADYANGTIVTLREVSDAQLRALYDRCAFTVFPSLVEGWGLPVGESLVFGKPCAASNASSIPEVGGDLVEYFDPWNITEADAVIRRLLFDEAHRAAVEARVRAAFRPRRWAETADAFAAAARRLSDEAARAAPARPAWPVLLEPGVPHRVGHDRPRGCWPDGGSDARAELACLIEDWHRIEGWGVWAEAADARLAFATTAPPGSEIIVYVSAAPSPLRPGHKMALVDLGDPTAPSVAAPDGFAGLRLRVDESGAALIALRTIDTGPLRKIETELRDLRAGLLAFGYVPADAPEQRIALLERFAGMTLRAPKLREAQ